MKEPDEEKKPLHHWREQRWGGLSTCLCTRCLQLFTSVDGFDRHYIMNQVTGEMTCEDPATMRQKNGNPTFERVEKPGWNPAYVWSRYSPSRGVHPQWSKDVSTS